MCSKADDPSQNDGPTPDTRETIAATDLVTIQSRVRALVSSSMPNAWNEAVFAAIDVINGTPWEVALARGRTNTRRGS